jgi:curved DNA-binding protein CbpA
VQSATVGEPREGKIQSGWRWRRFSESGRLVAMDAFDMLGLPRRPWLDPAAVRAAFQERARTLHPDAESGDAEEFARLNAAQAALSHPATRLRLLVGEKMPQGAAATDADLFLRIGAVVQEARGVRARLDEVTSPLARALLATEIAEVRPELTACAEIVETALAGAEEELRSLDEAWPDVASEALARLAARFERLLRWRKELSDRILELTSP